MRLNSATFVICFVIAAHQCGGTSTTVGASNTDTTNAPTAETASSGYVASYTINSATGNVANASSASNSATNNTSNTASSATTTSNATTTGTDSTYENMIANSTITVKPGAIFAASQSYLVRYGDSECFCSALCHSDPRCKHSCWITYPDIGYCRLTDFDYVNIVQLKRFSGYTAFDMPSNVFLGPDNKLYFMVNKTLTFQNAVKACASQDNFQIGIYKTRLQHDLLIETVAKYKQEIWVDMNSIENGPPNAYAVWADGTPFNDTEISKLKLATLSSNEASTTNVVKFRFMSDFWDIKISSSIAKYLVLCQERIVPK